MKLHRVHSLDSSQIRQLQTMVNKCTDSDGTYGLAHSWAEINGLVYDPLFAEAKDYNKYYGAPYGVYELHPILRVAL